MKIGQLIQWNKAASYSNCFCSISSIAGS